jgi:hypothetical protein
MRKMLMFLSLVLVATLGYAQGAPGGRLLFANYDLDGIAAVDDYIVASAALADSTTYVKAHQPDVARPLIITITDADSSITAGTITITGTDDLGAALTHVFTFAAGGSTTSTSTGYFKTVSSVVTSALTGEGAGDVVKVGTTTTIPTQYCLFGALANGSGKAKTTGSSTSLTSATALSGAFAGVAVADLIRVQVNGVMYERTVTTVTDIDNIVVDAAINLAAGYMFQYAHMTCGTGSESGWFAVDDCENALVVVDVRQDTMTGGVVGTVYCRMTDSYVSTPQSIGTNTWATATPASWKQLVSDPWDQCRVGLKVGTSDDATDTGTDKEVIAAYVRCENRYK